MEKPGGSRTKLGGESERPLDFCLGEPTILDQSSNARISGELSFQRRSKLAFFPASNGLVERKSGERQAKLLGVSSVYLHQAPRIGRALEIDNWLVSGKYSVPCP